MTLWPPFSQLPAHCTFLPGEKELLSQRPEQLDPCRLAMQSQGRETWAGKTRVLDQGRSLGNPVHFLEL